MLLEPTMFACRILNLENGELEVKGALHGIYTASSVHLSFVVLLSLRKWLYDVHCCTQGCAPKFEQMIDDELSWGLFNSYMSNC